MEQPNSRTNSGNCLRKRPSEAGSERRAGVGGGTCKFKGDGERIISGILSGWWSVLPFLR